MESGDWNSKIIYPHCDARILHLPHECDYCGMCDELQEERARLNVSNTGVANRQWPCPADRARSQKDYHAWDGNRPKKDVKPIYIEVRDGVIHVKAGDE